MKLLGLDIGQRRIGVAIADGEVIGSGETIVYNTLSDAIGQVIGVIRAENIEKIVIGLPEGNQQSEDVVRSFAMDLNKQLELEIVFTNEAMTSKEAERMMRGAKNDPRSEKYKQETDRISAKLILEQYIKEQN